MRIPSLHRLAARPRTVPALALLAVALLAGDALAQVPGRIRTDSKTIDGAVRWKGVAKKYVVSQSGAGGQQIEIEVDPAQVVEILVQKPKDFDAVAQAVQSGKNLAAAIPVLDKIAQDYLMLQWDEPATRWLAEAHLQNGDAPAAVKACERVVAVRPQAAYLGDMAVTYWQALLKTGKTARLDDYTDQAIRSGNREASAYALLLRGDARMARNEPREALKDGYLRVALLYENVRSVQPEALYKAMKAFEALQQMPHAEKMRTRLLSDYGTSDWARKL